jgi:hypothetical protein
MNYYLFDSKNRSFTFHEYLPDTFGNITGFADCNYETVKDLTWAGYPHLGFLSEEDSMKEGIPLILIEANRLKTIDGQWAKIRGIRDAYIQDVRWRIERYDDERKLGLHTTEDVTPLLQYIQELRNITTQSDPFKIVWPHQK